MYIHLYTVLGLIITTAAIFYLLPRQTKLMQALIIAVWLLGCAYIYVNVVEKANDHMVHSTDIMV
jgi:hypothetical protein